MTEEALRGDIITKERMKMADVERLEGKSGGLEFRVKAQIPLDYYFNKRLIEKNEFIAGSRIFKDYVISGQTHSCTVNLNAIRSDGREITEKQLEALQNWRQAIDSVSGTMGKLMIWNVCCIGMYLKDISYSPYNNRQALPRFREALNDLHIHYEKNKNSY